MTRMLTGVLGVWCLSTGVVTAEELPTTSATHPGGTDSGEVAPVPTESASSSTTAGEELRFDDITAEDAPPPPSLTHWYDQLHLSGRFDFNFEMDNPGNPPEETEEGAAPVPRQHFRNYHHFVFLKATPSDKLTVEVELVDQSFYEVRYRPVPALELKAGKIWVPFGASPFHHYYGARQGSPFQGLLLPNVWSEYGAAASYSLLNTSVVTIDADTYTIRGFDGSEGAVLALNNGGTDGRFAVGQRIHVGIGSKVNLWGSVMGNRWGLQDEGRLVLWGGDLRLDYGLVPVPVLKDFSVKMAMARADIQDTTLDPELNPEGRYWRYGDYVEVGYGGLRPYTTLRVRYGTIINYNLEISQKDTHNWTVAAISPVTDNLQLLLEYQWNMEEIDEVDNDLFRAQLALDF